MLWFLHLPQFWKALLRSLIALLTLAGIIIRPFRWNEARIAMSGAGVLLVLGLIGLIVNHAAEWGADLLIVCSRAAYRMREEVGPRSVGHVARFVVDHAPCPVLLLRPMARQRFPIQR